MNLEAVEKATILRAVLGSSAHGLSLDANGQSSDRDEIGVCLESKETFVGFSNFEQYEYRTATERTGKHDAPSEVGDLDLTIYGLHKFLRLCLKGNPTVVTLLFAKECVQVDARGRQLQDLTPYIIARRTTGQAFLGYMQAQRMRLLGELGSKKVKRPELEEKYGFDTKYAMHILRLGLQGIELLTTGRINLPMQKDSREWLLDVRKGAVGLQDVVTKAGQLEQELKDLIDAGPIQEQPNRPVVEDWMINMYFQHWKSTETSYGGGRMEDIKR